MLSADQRSVRRRVPVPDYSIPDLQRRIVVVEHLPAGNTIGEVRGQHRTAAWGEKLGQVWVTVWAGIMYLVLASWDQQHGGLLLHEPPAQPLSICSQTAASLVRTHCCALRPLTESVSEIFSVFGRVKVVRICSRDSRGKLPGWMTVSALLQQERAICRVEYNIPDQESLLERSVMAVKR